jgi:signal transduction histidine kinase
MFNRIRLTLTLWYVGVLLGIVAVVAGITYAALYQSLSSEVDDSLEGSARQIAAQLSEESLSGVQPATDTQAESGENDEGEEEDDEDHGVRFFGATSGDTFYLVLDSGGSPVLDPLNVNIEEVPDRGAALQAARDGSHWKTFTSDGADYRLYSRAVLDEGRTIAVVQVGRSLEKHQEQLRTLLIVLIVTAGGGLVLAAAGGLFVAGRALRPVRDAFSRQRAFVADASHELRTPLTLLRGNAEILQLKAGAALSTADSQALAEIIRQTGDIERLIGDLSTLARMDEGSLVLQPTVVDVSSLLRGVADNARTLAGNKPLKIDLQMESDMQLVADEARLRELLLALVDNAVRYTPSGGTIMLRGAGGASHIELSVSDTGPGIPPQHIDRVFERFHRVDPSRSRQEGGSGLGLAIARAIAEAHGGTIIASSSHGNGATFTVQLPRSGPPALEG